MTWAVGARRRVLDARLARAVALAGERPAAAALLTFYAAVAKRQRALLVAADRVLPAGPAAGAEFVDGLDAAAAAALVPPMLHWLRTAAPSPGEAMVDRLPAVVDWRPLCEERWRGSEAMAGGDVAAFVVESVLQPFAELGADAAGGAVTAGQNATRCPRCAGPALVGVLRERGHGAGRSLVCGLCASEWAVPRAVCPACGEHRVDALPVFRDGDLQAVRLDACETCRVYVKAVDLTVDGRLDPLVDDLATPALDLWAAGEGYRRLRPNLLRI